MNFLAQVLETAGEAEVLDLKNKIHEVEEKITSLDVETKDYLENNYARFSTLLQENNLMIKAKELSSEVELLQTRIHSQIIRDLNNSVNDVTNLKTKLHETDASLHIVKQLLEVDDTIKAAEEDQNRNCYLEAAKKFKNLKEILTMNDQIKNLTVYYSLTNYVSSLHDKFLHDSLVVWNNFLSWDDVNMPDNSKKLTLTIHNIDGKSDVICVLLYYDYLDYELKLLSKRLFDSLLEPIVKFKTKLKILSNDGIWTVLLEFKSEESLMKNDADECCEVVDRLSDLFSIIFDSLDVFISEDQTFVNKLGELLENDFYECLMEHFLYTAIPTKKEELVEFQKVLEKITLFDQFLKEHDFIKSSNVLMVDYVQNVNNLFVSKTCQSYLTTARKIFDEDLHDMIQVTSSSNENKEKLNNMDDTDLLLCKNIVQFPTCYISKSTKKLIQLIHDGLEKIRESENISGTELFYTIRNIVSLYCDLMPLKHNILLKSIPQQAALFYNNCMYLAHEIALLGIQCSSLLTKDISTTFVDFIEPLRSLGSNVLNSQTESQWEQLLEILLNSALFQLEEDKEFPSSIEKSLRQCLRQLTLLQSVWQNILPTSVYSKTIGKLCNSFVEKLIESVLLLNDITMDTASQLTNVFTTVLNKIPRIFPDSKEIFRHVKRWSKFSELLIVLNGSLKDIDDRWADGKGPLALEFTADQIKHLIRALFQPTDRRSALLSRVR